MIGNNGSGKTTLLRLLVGLLKPKSGTIKIFNEILTRDKKQLWRHRQKIGFLFQNPDDQLFAPTIEEDVGFAARNLKLDEEEVKNRVKWALEAVNLLDFKEKSPFNLSWGQKKRAALAGLLVMKPKLLILDEPFANLDFKSIYNHLKILEELKKDKARLDWLETQSCWIGVYGDYELKAKWYGGECYIDSVREICDKGMKSENHNSVK